MRYLLCLLSVLILSGCWETCPEPGVLVGKRFVEAHTESYLAQQCFPGYKGQLSCTPVTRYSYVPDMWYLTYESEVSGDRKLFSVPQAEFDNPQERVTLKFLRWECLTGESCNEEQTN